MRQRRGRRDRETSTPASLVCEIPRDEQPRERLLRCGPQALSDAELVAVLLRTGRPGASVTDLARELLDRNGGLTGLLGASPRSLWGRGVAEAKVATVIAALEIACRLARSEIPDREPMENPGTVAHYLSLRYQRHDQEVMGALFLDTRNRLIGESDPFRGTLSRAAVEPRAILKEGLLRGAAGVVLFHTHPSGDPSPSAEDIAFTRRMAEAGEAVGIRLVDHLILGAGSRWVSLKRRGSW